MKAANASLSIIAKDSEDKEVYTKNNLTIADIALTFTDIALTFTDITLKQSLLWHINHPLVYTCELTLTINRRELHATERFDFRHIEFKEKALFL